MHRKLSQLSGPISNPIHQAVDIAYAVASLISNWLEGNGTSRPLFVRNGQEMITLNLDPSSDPPVLYFLNADPSNYGIVTTAQTGALTGDIGVLNLALGSQTLLIPPSSVPVLFQDYPTYMKGLMAVTMVPGASPGSPVPILALSGCNLSTSTNVPLTGTCSFYIDADAGNIVLDNTNGSSQITGVFTVQTGAPDQTFQLSATAEAGGAGTAAFPTLIGGQLISQLNVVLWGDPGFVIPHTAA